MLPRLLKQMRTDESFNKFLNVKRGAAMHTLESLMLLPVRDTVHVHVNITVPFIKI